MTRKTSYFPIQGGEDLSQPALSVKPGRLLFSQNYECDEKGRPRRINGYERFDGHPSPSDAAYWTLEFTGGANPNLLTNASFETGDPPDDWLLAGGSWGGTLVQSTEHVVSGTYSAKLSGTGNAVSMSQNIASPASYDGLTLVFQCWVYCEVADKVRLRIGDTSGSEEFAYGAFHSGSGLELLTVEKLCRSSLTGLRVLAYCDTGFTGSIYCDVARLYLSTDPLTLGDTVAGATSGAYGEFLSATVTSGSWAGADAVGTMVLTAVSGTFTEDEDLELSAAVIATLDGEAVYRGKSDAAEDLAWIAAGVELARDKISAVPGSGNILGVWEYKNVVYAFRNNAGGTAAAMYKSSATGWQLVDLGELIYFDAGTTEYAEGETLAGVTSGASATIERVILTGGAWVDNDAEGYLVISGRGETSYQNNEALTSASGAATANGTEVAITLNPDGYYRFDNYNFYATASKFRMYGCDGENPAFEFDGTVFAPIETGMGSVYPTHVKAHKHHLFLAYPGGSLQHSATGLPLSWSALEGANEIGMGEAITGLVSLPNVLGIWGENRVSLLYGSSTEDWDLRLLTDVDGGVENSIQRPGTFLGKSGITILSAVQEYGDFGTVVVSDAIKPYLNRKLGTSVSSSIISQTKGHYRLFYADGEGINLSMKSGEIRGLTRLRYEHPVLCTCSENRLFFGSDDGFVYELDKGTSFDGTAIEAYLRIAFNHLGSPQHKKRFFKMVLEMEGRGTMFFAQDYSYGDEQILEGSSGLSYVALRPQGFFQPVNIFSGGGVWGVDDWGEFVWAGPLIDSAVARLEGSGVNIGITIASTGTYEEPHVIQGVILHYAVRGLMR